MDIPTLTHDEFDELAKGEYAPQPFILQAHEPEDIFGSTPGEPKTQGIRVYFLPVRQAHMYMQHSGKPALVLPIKAIDYDDLSAVYPEHEAWCYTISESYNEDLDERDFFFRDGDDTTDGRRKLAPFKLGVTETH